MFTRAYILFEHNIYVEIIVPQNSNHLIKASRKARFHLEIKRYK